MSDRVSKQLLDSWVAGGLISAEQAEAIWRFENAPAQTTTREAKRIPASAEVLGYVGGSLALAALVALSASYWRDLGTAGRMALFGIVAAICLVSGWWLFSTVAPQARRLGSFLLFVGVAALGCFAGLAAFNWVTNYGASVAAGACAAFVGGVAVWWWHRTSIQLIAMTLALAVLIAAGSYAWASADSSSESTTGTMIWGFGYLVLGVVWCVLGQTQRLKPADTAWALGSLALLGGPEVLARYTTNWEDRGSPYLLLGIAVSLVLLGAGVRLGRTLVLALGAAGIVIYVPQLLYWLFGDAMGVPIALLIAGFLLLGMSGIVVALRSRIKKPPVKHQE